MDENLAPEDVSALLAQQDASREFFGPDDPAGCQWRLSWEMPDPHQVALIEASGGPGVWPTYDWDTLGEWRRVERITDTRSDVESQYLTLKLWAENREQPIRNVVLETRAPGEWVPVGPGEARKWPQMTEDRRDTFERLFHARFLFALGLTQGTADPDTYEALGALAKSCSYALFAIARKDV